MTKESKEKTTIKFHNILHRLAKAVHLFYEICIVLKAIIEIFS